MVQNGWVEEVQGLLNCGVTVADPAMRAIGYSEMAKAVLGQVELEEAIATTIAETRRYAKRQRTWLRSEPSVIRIEPTESEQFTNAVITIQSFLQ